MKSIFILFYFLLSSVAFSQSLSLFDVDATSFPTMRGKFYAFDGQGQQIRPSVGDLTITENGIPRTITNVSCPPPQAPQRLSVVLVIDISGSMDWGMNDNNINLAKAAARSWVNGLSLGTSECAITSFDNSNYLNQDFTTSRTKLLNAITPLSPQGGTDYDAALIDPMAGGLFVSQKGKYQKVIIFLTDGQASEPKTQQIIQEANRQNCIIYCVTLGISAPQSIKDITNQTGGKVFERVTTLQEAKTINNSILQTVQGSLPCTMEWTSAVSCESGVGTSVVLQWQSQQATSSYQSPSTSVASLEYAPQILRFENPPVGVPVNQTVTVTARNAVFNVSNITSSNAAFTVNPTSFSLQPNQSQQLTVTYRAVDSGYTFTRFTIENDKCPKTYDVSGGHRGKQPTEQSLKLTEPNGGETYTVGSDTLITWEGIASQELVRLEYSIDNGSTWKYMDTARGLSYKWKKVPKPSSQLCLVRIKQVMETNSNNSDTVRTLTGHNRPIWSVVFSPDGNTVASGGEDNTIKIWDTYTGALLRTLTGHILWVSTLAYSPDGRTIASGSGDNTIKIWDVNTGALIGTLTGHTEAIESVAFSPDGSIIVSGADTTIITWDANTGALLRTLTDHADTVLSVAFSPDGNTIASGGWDKNINILDANTGAVLRTLTGHTNIVTSVAFSPDGSTLASGSYDRTVKIWDANTGALLRTLSGHTNWVSSVVYSSNSNIIASGSGDRTVKIWDVNTSILIRTLKGHTGEIWDVAISPDGSMIASGSRDHTIKIWSDYVDFIQEDISDTLFSIVEPIAQSSSIDIGQVLLTTEKDSVVIDFVRNSGTWEFRVDSIYFRGADAGAFSLVGGLPRYTVAASSSHFAEFRFTPNRVGVHTAEIVIITQSDTVVQTITGTGVEPQLQILANFIDFGEVEIGNERVITDTLVLKNVSTFPITIDNTMLMSPDIEQFEIISGGGNFTLTSGEERLVSARFKPKYGGRTSGRIGFEYNGTGSPAIAQLFGTGIGGFVYVPNDSGYAGDRKSIRLMLGNVKPEGIASLAPKFKAILRLQNNLIVPIDGSTTTIVNDSMFITVSGTIGSTSELTQIPIVVCLGTIEYTYIDIVDFRLEDNNGNPVEYNFETSSGLFTLLGICREGGSRLVFDNAVPYLLMVTPNPSEGNVEVDVNVIEEGRSTLKIFNGNGSLIEEHSFTTLGNKKVAIDTKGYSNGLYFITLQTPSTFDKTKLLLVK